MFRLTIKGLWAQKVRYALTGLAVVLGVAFMAGTMVLTDTMKTAFDGVFEAANDGTDVIVRRAAGLEGEDVILRDRVDASVVDRVAAVDDVAVARGSIQGITTLVHADGTTTSTNGLGVTVGTNWIDDERLNPFTLADGRAPSADDEAVLDVRTVEDEGWSLGDAVTLVTNAGPRQLTLVGTASFGAIDGLPGASLVATTDATAQVLFAETGRYDSVVVAGDDVDADELTARIASQVAVDGSGLEALSGAQETQDNQDDLAEDLGFVEQFLMAFAYVALFVGMFIIYNTFSIVVAQRMKDVAMLRAIGARRAQVLRSVVLESVVVGIVSAAAGLVAGIGLSFGLRALLASAGVDLPSGSVVVQSGTVVTAFMVGTVITLLSAVVPAVRASRVRPIAALREIAVDRSGLSIGRVAFGLLLTGIGVTSFAAGVAASSADALPFVGLGAMTVVLGVFVLGPVLVRPGVRMLGAPLARFGITGRYARENAHRSPRRTAATASALMIGVALVGFITILAASTSSSIAATVDRSFRSDFVIESGSFTGGLGVAIEDELRALPEVDVLSPQRQALIEVDGATTDVMGVDTAVIERLYDMQVTSGSLADVHGSTVAVAADRAAEGELVIGDTVSLRFADGSDVPLTVAAVFDGNSVGGDASWIVGLDTYEAHVTDQLDRRIFLSIDDGVTAADARAALDAALVDWPNAEVQDRADFKEAIVGQIEQMLNLVYGLLALAVIIALIGIANTLALSVHERTRELGVLRAIGMHRRQVKRAIRWESSLIAVLGASMGFVLAVGGAWAIVRAMGSEGVTELTLPWARLAVIFAMAGIAGVLAATGPARRASKLNVLEAIASE